MGKKRTKGKSVPDKASSESTGISHLLLLKPGTRAKGTVFVKFIFMGTGAFSWMRVCIVCMQCPRRPEEGIISPVSGVRRL